MKGHSRGLLRIAPELEELGSKVLEVEMGAARERQSLRDERAGAPPAGGQRNDRTWREGWASFSRELLPLPFPFPENEVVESERIRGLSRAVRSRVKRRVGWQGWANAGVRGMNEIFGKTAASEARGRPSAMQLSSLSRIWDAFRGISAADCNSNAEAFKALCGSLPGYTGNGVKQATFKEGLDSLPDPGAKMADGAALLIGSNLEAWRDWRRVLLRSPSELHEVIAREG